MESTSRVKGLVLTSRRDWVQRTYGRANWEKVVATLPAESRGILGGTIHATAWCSLKVNEELDWAICRELAGNDRTIFRRLGAHTADLIIRTSYPKHVKTRDPIGFLKAVGRQAPRYYDGLEVSADVIDPHHVVLRFSGIVSNVPNCDSNMGYYERGVQICGGTDARGKETACTGDGEPADLYDFVWKTNGASPPEQ